jgi:hypothetical protein
MKFLLSDGRITCPGLWASGLRRRYFNDYFLGLNMPFLKKQISSSIAKKNQLTLLA